jgi:cation diffusion facilitator CzcD-associated flavoprotein CzcO
MGPGIWVRNWPAKIEDATGQPVLDVLIVGTGMNGIAAAGSLMFKGIRNIAVVERSRPGQEPWLTFARMDTLRSPKTLAGPALGIPSLTFHAFSTSTVCMSFDRSSSIS